MKQIYVNGSSLSCGGGLEPNTQAFSIYTESVKKWDNSKNVSYGNQLGVLLGVDVVNESKQGGGLDRLIRKTYEVIDSADSSANLTAKTTAIKLIADIESKRLEMLQKAGLLDNKEIAEQIIEMERKHDILIKILKDIASSHPEIREEIMKRLSEIQTEVIVIDND